MKFAQMYNTAKCYPTRACLQTGVYFQRTDREFSHTATLGEVFTGRLHHPVVGQAPREIQSGDAGL